MKVRFSIEGRGIFNIFFSECEGSHVFLSGEVNYIRSIFNGKYTPIILRDTLFLCGDPCGVSSLL